MTQTRFQLMVATGYAMAAIVQCNFSRKPNPSSPPCGRGNKAMRSFSCARRTAHQPCFASHFLDFLCLHSRRCTRWWTRCSWPGRSGRPARPRSSSSSSCSSRWSRSKRASPPPASHSAALAHQPRPYAPHPPIPPICYHHSGGPAPRPQLSVLEVEIHNIVYIWMLKAEVQSVCHRSYRRLYISMF